MSEFSILGTLRTNLLQCKNILESLYSKENVKLIESNNVIVCDYDSFSLSIEPYEYKDINLTETVDFYVSARFEGEYKDLKVALDKFISALDNNSVTYNFDLQEEDDDGNPLGDEINISSG